MQDKNGAKCALFSTSDAKQPPLYVGPSVTLFNTNQHCCHSPARLSISVYSNLCLLDQIKNCSSSNTGGEKQKNNNICMRNNSILKKKEEPFTLM